MKWRARIRTLGWGKWEWFLCATKPPQYLTLPAVCFCCKKCYFGPFDRSFRFPNAVKNSLKQTTYLFEIRNFLILIYCDGAETVRAMQLKSYFLKLSFETFQVNSKMEAFQQPEVSIPFSIKVMTRRRKLNLGGGGAHRKILKPQNPFFSEKHNILKKG